MRSLLADFTVGDLFVFVAASLLVVVSYNLFWSHEPAHHAVVRNHLDDKLELDLHIDRKISVAGKLGDSVLEVKDGQLRFTASPCKNKLCIHSGWHSHGGEVAACLPNRVIVQLASNDNERAYDAINF